MRTILLVSVLLLAGCTTTFDEEAARDEAQAAADRLGTDFGPTGDGKRMTMRIFTDLGENFTMEVLATIDLHKDDAFSLTAGFGTFIVDGHDRSETVKDISIRFLCTTERYVLITEGMEAMEQEDHSLETENTGGCLSGLADPESMQAITDRLGESFASIQQVLAFAQQAPTLELVEVADGGGHIKATYNLDVNGQDMRMQAKVDDRRVQEQKGRTTVEAFDMKITIAIDLTYDYGTRTAAPDWRGDEQA